MPVANPQSISKEKALSVIYDFQKWLSEGKDPSKSDVEKYLSPHFKITSNGILIAQSSTEYLARLKIFHEKYSKMEISKPLQEPLHHGNEIAIYYRANLTPRKGGAAKQVYILAIGSIEDNRIARWTQVSHEEGTGNWDK